MPKDELLDELKDMLQHARCIVFLHDDAPDAPAAPPAARTTRRELTPEEQEIIADVERTMGLPVSAQNVLIRDCLTQGTVQVIPEAPEAAVGGVDPVYTDRQVLDGLGGLCRNCTDTLNAQSFALDYLQECADQNREPSWSDYTRRMVQATCDQLCDTLAGSDGLIDWLN